MRMGRNKRVLAKQLVVGVGAFLAAVVVRPAVVHAWPANDANCTANMVLSAGNSLNFGAIVGSAGGGSVTVTTGSTISSSIGVTPAGGTVSAATISGTDTGVNANPPTGCTTKSLTVTVGGATLTAMGTGMTMTVNAMTDSVTESGTGLWDYKTTPISIGGTLNVNPNQDGGNYSGTFTVTITYP
jgi:hypothetical protein